MAPASRASDPKPTDIKDIIYRFVHKGAPIPLDISEFTRLSSLPASLLQREKFSSKGLTRGETRDIADEITQLICYDSRG